jgi:hypothetical protein
MEGKSHINNEISYLNDTIGITAQKNVRDLKEIWIHKLASLDGLFAP